MYRHPQSRLSRLPPLLSRWLGYRATPPPPHAPYIVHLWSFIGAFAGIAVVQAVFTQAEYFVRRGVPGIVASYSPSNASNGTTSLMAAVPLTQGASAVLIYGSIDAPLAQPRGLIGGHFLGALIGVSITKLFMLLPSKERYDQLQWLAGSLACATSVVCMQVTRTTHPPAGATALLAAINSDIRLLGWYYVPVVLLSSFLALSVALLTNNIQRRYPLYWFAPPPAPTDMPARSMPAGNQRKSDGAGKGEKLDTKAEKKMAGGETPESVTEVGTPDSGSFYDISLDIGDEEVGMAS